MLVLTHYSLIFVVVTSRSQLISLGHHQHWISLEMFMAPHHYQGPHTLPLMKPFLDWMVEAPGLMRWMRQFLDPCDFSLYIMLL